MNTWRVILLAATLAATSGAWSADSTDAVAARLKALFPGEEIHPLEPSPVPGFYETQLSGEVVYVAESGDFLFHGSLYDLRNGLVNVTETRRNDMRRDAIAAVSEDKMITFGPADAAHTISVFTDIDCGYCRKLHGEMDKYNAAGIRVRYLFYPRSGPGTESFKKAISVWCADDRRAAMTAAKKGDDVEPRECDNPVLEDYRLGQNLGVTGTPALVLEDGSLVPGYVPAARLKLMLDAARAEKRGG